MAAPETRLGGDRESFPETVWSAILRERDPESPRWRERVNDLCSRYWKPVYAYIRVAWSKSIEDAKDLTQAFFTHLLDSDFFANYRKEHGRFRHFLKGALRHFLGSEDRSARALKRGGDRFLHSLDVRDVETPEFQTGARTPDEQFDLEWRREVLARSIDRMKERLTKEGKESYITVYESYELVPDPPSYEELAGSLGVAVHDVRNQLHYVRGLLRKLVLETVREYVTDRNELFDEINELFSS